MLSFKEHSMYPHREELKIVDVFRKSLFAEFTLRELMVRTGKKSYNWMHKAVSRLASASLLAAKKKGKTIVLQAKLDNPALITYFIQLDREEAYAKQVPLAEQLIARISVRTPFFILLVTGSYATGKQNANSDIDIAIIVPEARDREAILPYVAEVKRLAQPPIDAHIFTKGEFLKMLLRDEENFGKEAFRKRLLFYGAEQYYQIIREAARNGLPAKI